MYFLSPFYFIQSAMRSTHFSTCSLISNFDFLIENFPDLIWKKSRVSLTRNINKFVELLAILIHLSTSGLETLFFINESILVIVFKGVLISWDVEAIIVSVNFSIDLAYSILANSDMSLIITKLHSC